MPTLRVSPSGDDTLVPDIDVARWKADWSHVWIELNGKG